MAKPILRKKTLCSIKTPNILAHVSTQQRLLSPLTFFWKNAELKKNLTLFVI